MLLFKVSHVIDKLDAEKSHLTNKTTLMRSITATDKIYLTGTGFAL